LLLNSVFSGAVAGTPGTTPTNFTFAVSGGSIDSVTLGADGVSNVLTLSATAARQIFDRSITVSASTVYQAQITLISNANSITIAQLLTWISPPAGSTVAYFINGSAALGTDVPSANALIVAQLTVSVTAGTATYRFGIGTGGADTGTAAFTRPQVEQRSSVTAYTPTTTQPITNYIPVLQTASANVARFDHNPVTGESLGLLVEEQRTNLFTYSEQFDNAAWTKLNATVSANQIIAPDGTLTMDKLVASAVSGTHRVSKPVAINGVYTLSVFAKAGEESFLNIWSDSVAYGIAYFDLVNGTVTVTTGTQLASASIKDVGNGLYRCSITTPSLNKTAYFVIGMGNPESYTGDGVSGVYLWGAQLEAGAFPTSYIPTVASQVTRAIDSASMTGANFSEWYRADEGTLFADYVATQTDIGTVVSVASTGNTNPLGIFENWGGANVRVGIPAVAFLDSSGVAITANTQYKTAFAIKSGDFASSTNASTAQTSSGNYPSYVNNAISLTIGGPSSLGSFQYVNSTIKKIAYYPQRLTNTQLQALTS
jgi:predicted hotdog family 3-hydroxylacyl-ACP dehydratase